MPKRTNRIAIFIDFDNFTSGYYRKLKKKEIEFEDWKVLNENLIKRYKYLFPFKEVIDHVGTWISIGISEYPSKREREFLRNLHRIDCINKFNVKYGYRNRSGKEKGVDTEIICQMLEYAILDEYDNAILLSDDTDFVPAVYRIQDRYGKRIIQAGFEEISRLRAACYGNIKLENANTSFDFFEED